MVKYYKFVSILLLGFALCSPKQAIAVNGATVTENSTPQQSSVIKGTIEDSMGPIAGASVTVKGTMRGTASDIDGNFSISAKAGEVLVFTYIGYINQEITIDGSTELKIFLVEDSKQLDEVVITASGAFRSRRGQGYTTTKISTEELTASKAPTLGAGLVAKVPGLQINATSSGVDPNYSLVLRGNRSITGNNEALIVVDNAIVSGDFLSNVNPEDVEDIQILNGAAGATLYGSEASNGVLLVTTKKGQKGRAVIKFSNTLTFESVNFRPKTQNRFGQGSQSITALFDPIENQQYGPAFDGSLKELGYPLENGDQQYMTYTAKPDRDNFWETGVQNLTDLSFSSGGDNYSSYVAAQYQTSTGTTPNDKYNRVSIRMNNTLQVLPNLNLVYGASYVENNYDITTATSGVYSQLLNVAANIPILSYKDWENDIWASPEGWFNPWYRNPYYTIDNNRQDRKNAYLTGKVELKWDIAPWMYVLYRNTLSNRYDQYKNTIEKLTYSDYANTVQTKSNVVGQVRDQHFNQNRINQDFIIGISKDITDYAFDLLLGASTSDRSSKRTRMTGDGLVIPGLFNIGNRVGNVDPEQEELHSRSYGFWGDLNIGYKNYLFLHVTARKEWTSLLAKENRSYFYPSVDLSFVPTDVIAALKESSAIDFIKIRAALSQTGNVNIDPYSLSSVYESVAGFSSGTYFRQNVRLVSSDLKPEITKGWEVGTDFRLFKNYIDASVNYYFTSTTGQAISASIAPSSGYSTYLLNTGEVTNEGIELALKLNPIRTKDWNVTIGGNYTHNKNLLKSLHPDTKRIGLGTSSDTNTTIFAEEGYPVNQLIVTDYNRDDQGRVIVNPVTGYPSIATETARIGNTTPKDRIGLDLKVRWKAFTLTTLFEYRGGYYFAAINQGSNMDFNGSAARTAYYNRERFVFPNSSYWDEASQQYVENTNITISDGGAGFWSMSTYNRGVQSNYVYSGNYWKWRELSLSYDVPRSFVAKIKGIQSARISAQGRNLFLWAPKANEYTDPDYTYNDQGIVGSGSLSQTPPTRYIGGNISLTF